MRLRLERRNVTAHRSDRERTFVGREIPARRANQFIEFTPVGPSRLGVSLALPN
jgi:hypothetical protein